MKYKFLIFLVLIVTLFFVPGALARTYGTCLYGEDLYGGGTCDATTVASSSSGGGGGGGGGSSPPSTSSFTSSSSYQVLDTESSSDAVKSITLLTSCLSGTCSISAKEAPYSASMQVSELSDDSMKFMLGEVITDQVAQSLSADKISTLTSIAKGISESKDFVKILGGYTANCNGDLGETTTEFEMDLSQLTEFGSGIECNNVAVAIVDGSAGQANKKTCSVEGSTLKMESSYAGCQKYVMVFASGGQAVPTAAAGSSSGTEAELASSDVSEGAAKPKTLGVVLVVLAIIVILGIGYVVFNRTRKKPF